VLFPESIAAQTGKLQLDNRWLTLTSSRARSLEGITLARPIAMGDVKASPAVNAFYSRLGIDS
jgi:hypothetical protein